MSNQQSTRSRLRCTVSGCNASLGRKADLLRHQEEKHGEMKFCSVPGCDYEGTKRSSRLQSHMEKKHPGSRSVVLVVPVDEPSSSQYLEEGDHREGSFTDEIAYPAQTGYQYTTPPAQMASSAASSWTATAYTSSDSVSNVAHTTSWSSMPQYQAQYQPQYQTQYQTQDSQTWPAEYSQAATYQTGYSSTYDAFTAYRGEDNPSQDYTEEGCDEDPDYTY